MTHSQITKMNICLVNIGMSTAKLLKRINCLEYAKYHLIRIFPDRSAQHVDCYTFSIVC